MRRIPHIFSVLSQSRSISTTAILVLLLALLVIFLIVRSLFALNVTLESYIDAKDVQALSVEVASMEAGLDSLATLERKMSAVNTVDLVSAISHKRSVEIKAVHRSTKRTQDKSMNEIEVQMTGDYGQLTQSVRDLEELSRARVAGLTLEGPRDSSGQIIATVTLEE